MSFIHRLIHAARAFWKTAPKPSTKKERVVEDDDVLPLSMIKLVKVAAIAFYLGCSLSAVISLLSNESLRDRVFNIDRILTFLRIF